MDTKPLADPDTAIVWAQVEIMKAEVRLNGGNLAAFMKARMVDVANDLLEKMVERGWIRAEDSAEVSNSWR
jgi:pentatricopeptide repeat protein